MRTLSSALITELGLTRTRPGYLVELNYSTVLRFSSMGNISWGSYVWAGANILVSNLSQDGKGFSTSSLSVGNTDSVMGALVLNEKANSKLVRIWTCYAGATAADDPVQEFYGVTDGAEIFPEKVQFQLVSQHNQTLESPRVFISQLTGFSFLKPAGSIVSVGGETFTLKAPVWSKV